MLETLAFALCGVGSSAYDATLAWNLTFVEKALYCGEERFNRWDVGDALVYGARVDTTKVRLTTRGLFLIGSFLMN